MGTVALSESEEISRFGLYYIYVTIVGGGVFRNRVGPGVRVQIFAASHPYFLTFSTATARCVLHAPTRRVVGA